MIQFLIFALFMVEFGFSSFAQKMLESKKPFMCKFQFIKNDVLQIKFQNKSEI